MGAEPPIGALGLDAANRCLERWHLLAASWHEVLPSDSVRTTAQRLLRVHVLGAADALQLAAATVAAEHEPASLEFLSLDDRLLEIASREGFRTLRV
jgi:predicted nucleic acid-binding protein